MTSTGLSKHYSYSKIKIISGEISDPNIKTVESYFDWN